VIDDVVATWHEFLRGQRPNALDELLHDECVFISPIVFTPQRGKAITMKYLQAAGATLAGVKEPSKGGDGKDRSFRYVKEVIAHPYAVLEFETYLGDTLVNGVDIITCDDDGKIIEFKVMVRPLQGVNAIHEFMGRALA